MPIAKKDLLDGFTVVAREGTYVSNDVVNKYGWAEDVEPGEDPVLNADKPGSDSDDLAPKGAPQVGAPGTPAP